MGRIEVGYRGPDIVTSNLILYLDAGSPNSYRTDYGTTWRDISGRGNNGTFVNNPVYNSVDGGVIVFNGTNSYVNVPGVNDDWFNPFTLNIWVYCLSLYDRMGLAARNDFREFGFNSTSISAWSPQGATPSATITPSDYVNKWRMITLTSSTTATAIFSNAVSIASSTQFAGGNGGDTFAIGVGFDTPGTNSLNGRVSIVQFYSRVLTTTEITQNYNAQKSRFGL